MAGRSGFGAGRGTTRGAGCDGSGGVGVVGGCSSMRRRIVGGTTRPGVGAFAGAAAGVSTGAGVSSTTGSPAGSTAGGGSITAAGAAGAASTVGSGDGGGGGSTATGCSATGAGGAGGLTVLTSRGGGSAGAAGLGGSGAFFDAAGFFPPLGAGVSANMSPPGSEMLRCLARRSTNWRATTSSIVLEALFTSIP
jgi:hypothetical protein